MTSQTETKTQELTFVMLKRGVSYRRVSTTDQADKGFSLPTQLKEIQDYAAKNSIELVADFWDDFTGSSLERSGLTQARQWLKSKKADCLICLDSDRLTREPAHYMTLRDELNSAGLELHYAKRGRIDLNDFGQMLVEDFYGRFAYEWKHKLIEATTRGRRGKVADGNIIVHGRPPFGYRCEMVDGKRMLVVYEPEAKIVITIFWLYAYKDFGYNAIAKYLTENNVPTRADTDQKVYKKKSKGTWSYATIQQIIWNPVYIGQWSYSKHTDDPIKLDVTPILDKELWQAAQNKRKANKGKALNPTNHEYLLSGRCRCGCCTHAAAGSRVDANNFYYRCIATSSQWRVSAKCNMPRFRADQVDAAVWDWIKSLLLDPVILERGLKEYQEKKEGQAIPLQDDLSRADKLLKQKQGKLARLLDIYLDGSLPKEEYQRTRRGLDADIADLAARCEELQEQLAVITLTPERIMNIHEFASRIRENLNIVENEENFSTRRQIMALLDVRAKMVIEDGEKIIYASCILNVDNDKRIGIDNFSCKTEISYTSITLTVRLVLSEAKR